MRRSNPLAFVTNKYTASGTITEIPNAIEHATQTDGQALVTAVANNLDQAPDDLANAFGLYDFYSAHILNYCEGSFVPGPFPNTTIPNDSISKNVVHCSHVSLLSVFDPSSALKRKLGASGPGFANLLWPSQMSSGLDALSKVQHAMKWLYVIASVFVCAAVIIIAIQPCMLGRIILKIPILLVKWTGLLTLGLASAMVTAFAVRSAKLINESGQDLEISASIGVKFLALTWAAVVAMLVAAVF